MGNASYPFNLYQKTGQSSPAGSLFDVDPLEREETTSHLRSSQSTPHVESLQS